MGKKKGWKITSISIVITFVIFWALSFFATPYVFNGVLMSPVWDDIRLIVLFLLLLEVAILDIRTFSVTQRILIWSYPVIFILGSYVISFRLTLNLLLIVTVISLYSLVKENKAKSLPMHRLTMMTLFGFVFILSSVLDLQLLDKHAFLISGAIAGIIFGVIGIILTRNKSVFENDHGYRWEVLLVFLIITPIAMFVLLNVMNYSLDFSEPTTCEVEISDLDVRAGYRQITQYKVYFEMDGETYEVGVPKHDFYSFHIGDRVEVNLYKGFFNEPYLVNE